MEQVQAGSQQAAWDVVQRYSHDVHRIVRRTLNRRLRSKFDSLDFVQIVWASFFRTPHRIKDVETPEQLVAYLATVAKFKVISEVRRRLQSAKYNLNREADRSDMQQTLGQLAATSPTPSSVAMAKERWEQLLAGEPEHVKQIVELRLQGVTFTSIAAELNIHERTARKVVQRLLQQAT
ncbi:RNA polymerase sigma factor [Anatilimnocola aggregata]|uniref:RNA polymerase sigma factor n=2 Tax=Anatilimnocola aggregata TaxID=2528021 RepID=A0A517Y7Q0_9BACT|nr:RNA polymerase sigma factor [Anatilimnocola aggregata]